MRAKLTDPGRFTAPDDGRARPEATTVDPLVNPRCGPIVRVSERDFRFAFDETFHVFTATSADLSALNSNGTGSRVIGEGAALSEEQARATAVGEAIERYCARLFDPSDLRNEPRARPRFGLDSLPWDGEAFVDGSVDESDFRWVRAADPLSEKASLIPAQVTCLREFPDEPTLYPNTTSGYAAGRTPWGAARRAVLELIERDHLLVGYLKQIEFPVVSFDHLSTHPDFRPMVSLLESTFGDLTVLSMDLDLPVSAYLAVGTDPPSDSVPQVLLAAGCDLDPAAAMSDALTELVHLTRLDVDPNGATPTDPVRTTAERARFWTDPDRRSLRFWTAQRSRTVRPHFDDTSRNRGLEELYASFAGDDRQLFLRDVTTDDIRAAGLVVVKAFAPGLQLLYLDETRRRIARARAEQLAETTPYETLPSGEFNNVPHPFL